MSTPRLLWQFPAEALRFNASTREWEVRSAPGLGRARALFAPVRQPQAEDGAWTLSLADEGPWRLTLVNDRTWIPVPIEPGRAGAGTTHYLCLVRYYQPPDRPGDEFLKVLLPDRDGLFPPEVDKDELQQVFDELQRADGDRFQSEVVPVPAGAPPSAGTAAGVARGMASAAAASAPEPPAAPQLLQFAFASCQYPAGFLDREIAHASYRGLADQVKAGLHLERLLLMGDQVYTDATYGLLDPARLDDRFRMPYEDLKNRATGPWACLPQHLLAAARMTLDDHELVDNWEPHYPGATGARFELGLAAYWAHQRREPPRDSIALPDDGPGWHLFMADTRTQRCHRCAETLSRASILGGPQTQALEDWLAQAPAEDLKIVTSAAMLLPRVLQYIDDPLYLDNWQGYPASFYRLLAFVCDRGLRNLVFLSGDTHLGCSVRVTVHNLTRGHSASFSSHHAPALYAPYPFANESPANLLLQDSFRFVIALDGTMCTYECTVEGELLAEGAQGCGLLTARRGPAGWASEASLIRPRDGAAAS